MSDTTCSRQDQPQAGPPRGLPVQTEHIPSLLQQARCWVVWQYVEDIDPDTGEVSWDKPPKRSADLGPASSTDPRTWSTFESAIGAYRHHDLDGIGYVLTSTDANEHIVGVDLDHCRDPQTGVIEQWAWDIAKALNTYCEVSPSGEGLRLFLLGNLPPGGRKRGHVEVYQTGRYVTVTGQRVEWALPTIERRQRELEAFHREHFPPRPDGAGSEADEEPPLSPEEIARRLGLAQRDERFLALWKGELNGYSSHSEADASLVNHLVYWLGRRYTQVSEVFARSGLFRAKWQREDYRRRTYDLALRGRTRFYRGGLRGRAVGGQAEFRNYDEREVSKGNGKKNLVKYGLPAQAIEARLKELSKGWPRRVGNLLFAEAPGPKPLWLETPSQLFAWISSLLPAGEANGLRWAQGPDMMSEGRFLAYLAQQSEAYDAVESYPHWPPLPSTYYMHPPVTGGDGRALRELVRRFSPATPVDQDLIEAFFLSLLWGGPPGSRPAWLFTCEEGDSKGGRGVGKSTVAKLGARLVGGHIDLASSDRMTDTITRLLSPDALERRVVLLDNLKTTKLSWGELEAAITTDSISGHRLYHGEGRRPNTLTYALTLNGASLSRDMAQRCVIVKLARPKYSATWERETIDLIERRRWEILGDILGRLQAAPTQQLAEFGRWGTWEADVLSRVAEPSECQTVISERQAEVDDDSSEAELVRQAFRASLEARNHDPDREVIWIDSRTAATWCNEALGERRPTQRATAYLETLTIPELRYSRRKTGRGFTWTGLESPQGAFAQKLKTPSAGLSGSAAW